MEYDKFMELVAQHDFSEDDAKQGGISFLGSKRDLVEAIKEVKEDEIPMGLVGGEFFYTGPGTAGRNNAVLVLTNERIIKADKKLKNTDYTFFYVDDINSSSFKTAFLSSELGISTTSGDISVNKVRKDTGKKFNDQLHVLISKSKKEQKGAKGGAAVSSMDEIRKAKSLFEEGIIDEAEFKAIKAKFL